MNKRNRKQQTFQKRARKSFVDVDVKDIKPVELNLQLEPEWTGSWEPIRISGLEPRPISKKPKR